MEWFPLWLSLGVSATATALTVLVGVPVVQQHEVEAALAEVELGHEHDVAPVG